MLDLKEKTLNQKIIDFLDKNKCKAFTTHDIRDALGNITSANTIKVRLKKMDTVTFGDVPSKPHYQLRRNVK